MTQAPPPNWQLQVTGIQAISTIGLKLYIASATENFLPNIGDIVPITEADAKAWVEQHCDGDTYVDIIGSVDE